MNEAALTDQYREFLDEVYPEITLGELTFSPSRVIEELDPVAFRCGFVDWCDSEGIDTDAEDEDDESDDED